MKACRAYGPFDEVHITKHGSGAERFRTVIWDDAYDLPRGKIADSPNGDSNPYLYLVRVENGAWRAPPLPGDTCLEEFPRR